MARSFAFLLLMFVITFPLSTNAEEHRKTGMLDIIPHDAWIAIAIKSVEETGQHFNNFSNDTNIRPMVQPAMGLQMGLAWLGAAEGLDRKSPIAIIYPDARKLKERSYFGRDGEDITKNSLVIALPFSNLNLLARGFNVNVKKLKTGATVKGKGVIIGKFFKVRGKYLYLGNNKKMVEDVVAAKSAATKMTTKQIKQANNTDALFLIGTRTWGKKWDEFTKDLDNGIKEMSDEIKNATNQSKNRRFPSIKKDFVLLKDFLILTKKLFKVADFGVLTIQYNKGVGVSGMVVFRENKTEERKKLLEDFRGSQVPSTLKELANDNLLFAYGHSVYTQEATLLLKLAVLATLKESRNTPPERISTIANNKNFYRFAKNFLQQSNGRGAIYLNRGKLSKGWVSATSIFEPKQADALLATLKKEATKINPAKTNLHLDQFGKKNKKPTATEQQIAKLIISLGDADFEIRASATGKLLEIGNEALIALQKAAKHRDKEIAIRAEQLVKQMTKIETVDSHQKGLPLFLPLLTSATYHYTPQAETINGEQVDIISIITTKLNGHDENYFKKLLGTNWKHIRVVPVKNKVVMHWGSDTISLQKTIKNIQSKKAGLAEHPSMKEHQQFSSHPQKMQMHFSLTNIIPFFLKDSRRILKRREKKSTPFSSISMTIDSEQLQFDAWIPKQDLKNALDGQKFEEINNLFSLHQMLR
ncbi:hypothetical protein MNBD_PLANCTO02-1024 [hydrothermal vent metagenome]|uniref:Uncharacterized protein n=1 Tax=hydrothermal vent metagenome TaxID=652676 RepID=A0A3B1DXJ7_9ZZZZ